MDINTPKNNVYSELVASSQTTYDFSNAIFENGAILGNGWAVHLGGPNDGSATVQVSVDSDGLYELNMTYAIKNKELTIDVNGVSTGNMYQTPDNNQGNFSIRLNLRSGVNNIKFHGNPPNYGPHLYEFTITLVQAQSTTYNLINGTLQGSARVDTNKNMVVGLGGPSNGQVTINVTANDSGYYAILINFNIGLRPFLIDINGVNTGRNYITPAIANGRYYIELNLNQGNNSLKFYGVSTRLAPNLGEFTLTFINTPSIPTQGYSVANGILENGARLNSLGNLVLNLGGSQNGSSTVTVNVSRAGIYELAVEFRIGSKYFRMDINGTAINSLFMTPAGRFGIFTVPISLKLGNNQIKFYGINTENASELGNFTLNFISTSPPPVLPPGTYDASNGTLENGAQLEMSTNFVTNLGGINDGSTTVTVNVNQSGRYSVDINYLMTNPNGVLNVTVNGRNVGMYDVNVTNGLTLTDVRVLTLQFNLNNGDNQIKFHGDLANEAPMIGLFTLTFNLPIRNSYTFADLNALSYANLVSILKRIRFDQIEGIFQFSPDSFIFYNDDNRIQVIIDELGRSGRLFTAQNENGIDTLVEVLRSGFYLGFYNQQLNRLTAINYKNRCLPAIRLVMNNPNFRLGTSVQDGVVHSIAKLIGNASADVGIINAFSIMLSNFNNNINQYSNERTKTAAVYKTISDIKLFLENEIVRNRNMVTNTAFYDTINPFLSQIESLAQNGLNFSVGSEWLANNCIFFVGKLAKFRRNTTITQTVLTNCLNIYPRLSRYYLEVLRQINDKFNNILSDGTVIDYNAEIGLAKQRYLPNQYSFDDGTMVIKTGNTVTEEKIKRVYWAAKEVKAQFMRISNNDVALEVGNADDVLTMVVYNDPTEYQLNTILYGYSTENGGIYIESIGTFFTYERTTLQSIFSLEELFRHEYVHYLQARYLIRGLFGQGILHQGERLTWFSEGFAEFLAGATRKENVKPRSSIVDTLAHNRERLTASEVLAVRYGSFNFYNYAFVFIYYMYTRQLNQLLEFIRLFIANDVNGYDNHRRFLSNDQSTSDQYEQTLDDLIANAVRYSVPAVSDDYLISHPDTTTDQILNDILSDMPMTNHSISTEDSVFFQTFIVRGVYDSGVSRGGLSDWQDMNSRLNDTLENLDAMQWSGYRTVTAYFTNYQVVNGRANFTVVFSGVYRVL